ncbi:hypothetical protein K438DRAFT_1608769 [Mycena galopus ATCC 62051]|nr:hypothetical protein K438DRAFT_1609548 [Mycena galopus ATCC 62051]KAF8175293.1 hypothetical protein K438DRAFT_1608769 [Mycena galopus ATCC 62051]
MPVRDVRHRWNYTHAMIKWGLMLRKAIGTWVFERDELQGLTLEPEDWVFLESLGELLEARAFFQFFFGSKLTFLLDVHKSN